MCPFLLCFRFMQLTYLTCSVSADVGIQSAGTLGTVENSRARRNMGGSGQSSSSAGDPHSAYTRPGGMIKIELGCHRLTPVFECVCT